MTSAMLQAFHSEPKSAAEELEAHIKAIDATQLHAAAKARLSPEGLSALSGTRLFRLSVWFSAVAAFATASSVVTVTTAQGTTSLRLRMKKLLVMNQT